MAKNLYIGVEGKARKAKKIYVGIGGTAREVKKAYIGVNGVARLFYSGGKRLSDLPVGTIVNFRENGTYVPYEIINQGAPSHQGEKFSCYYGGTTLEVTTSVYDSDFAVSKINDLAIQYFREHELGNWIRTFLLYEHFLSNDYR